VEFVALLVELGGAAAFALLLVRTRSLK